MLSLQGRPEAPAVTQAPCPTTTPAQAQELDCAVRPRHSHRALPGGGRIFVTLSDGTPIGMIRYDIEKREDALPLLLRAFASIVEERINRASEPSL